MTSSKASSNVLNPLTVILLVVIGIAALVGNVGCDTTGLGSYYDPTNDLLSVNGYRQDVMDASMQAWDDYIRE